jgi:uncharacterized phiE125 gp8 family phage protein
MTLIVAPTVEPITLAALKLQLGIQTSDTASDTVLTRRITEARKWVEGHTRRSLMPQTHELRLDAFPADGQIDLPFPPVVSVASVKYIASDGTLTTVDAADYALDAFPLVPFVRPVYGESWPSPRDETSAVRVQYVAGYAVSAVAAAKTITGITAATPGVVTSAGHGFADGDLILLDVAGMTELDGLIYRVYAKDTNTFQLAKLTNDSAISTAGYTAFTSGTATRVDVAVPEILIDAIALLVGHWTNYQSRIEAGNFITRVPVAVEQLLDSEKIWGVV